MSKMSTACDLCGQKKNWWRQGGGRPPGPPMPVSATGVDNIDDVHVYCNVSPSVMRLAKIGNWATRLLEWLSWVEYVT